MEQFSTIAAEFRPRRTDNLRPGWLGWVGRPATWEAQFVLESGPYKGQWAMVPQTEQPPPGWVPLSDLRAAPQPAGA